MLVIVGTVKVVMYISFAISSQKMDYSSYNVSGEMC